MSYARTRRPWGGVAVPLQIRLPRWSAPAWGAIAVTTSFVAITCWWLSQDHGIPGTEPGAALYAALVEHDMLRSGDLLGPLRYEAIHPPLLQIVGAVAMLVGGVGVSAPVVGENLVFVPLLALGCYQTAKLVAGPMAGLLAVVFALGSPLLIEQFHVFMVDAPEAALVALSVWLILASERFSRIGTAAAAGVAVGLGLEVKQQFPFMIAGLVAVVLLRERGWRNWRGLGVFALVAFAVGSPWYFAHFSEVATLTRDSVAAATPGTLPPRLSLTNLEWYGWAALNGVLFAPLFAVASIGVVKETAAVLKRRAASGVAPELLGGALVAWLALMATPIHTVRYMLPMTVYLAVLGTAWIVRLRPAWRALATGALALAVAATTLGATFGVGHPVRVMLTGRPVADRSIYGVASPNQVVLYSNRDFLVSEPRRAGDMLVLLRALRRHGVEAVTWLPNTEEPRYFDHYGLDALAAMARLGDLASFDPSSLPPHVALLVRQQTFGKAPPCLRLADGSGVWVRFGNAAAADNPDFCPFRQPAFYGP